MSWNGARWSGCHQHLYCVNHSSFRKHARPPTNIPLHVDIIIQMHPMDCFTCYCVFREVLQIF